MVGSHLLDYYASRVGKDHVIGTYHSPTIPLEDILQCSIPLELDVQDRKAVAALIEEFRPSKIFHLAAQSLPTVSWAKPNETIAINMLGTVNVFEAILSLRKTDRSYDPVVVVACSSAEYGASLSPENVPIKEEAPLLPLHPYGVSKVGQDLLAFQYHRNFGVRCIRARVFNTTGARKTNDAVSDFVHRALAVKRGKERALRVGNLETRRAITDVRDLVTALALLSEKGHWGEAYNISGDRVYQIREVIPLIEKVLGILLPVEVDPALLRPSDEPIIYGDSNKLKSHTGWRQQYSLEETIADMVRYLEGREKRLDDASGRAREPNP